MKKNVSNFALSAILCVTVNPLAWCSIPATTTGDISPIIQGNYNFVSITQKKIVISNKQTKQVIYSGIPLANYDSLIRKWEQTHRTLLHVKDQVISAQNSHIKDINRQNTNQEEQIYKLWNLIHDQQEDFGKRVDLFHNPYFCLKLF